MTSARRGIHMAVFVIMALFAAPLGAQAPTPLDTLKIRESIHAQIMALPTDTITAFCAPSYRRASRAVYIDTLRPAATPTNPECAPSEAHVLVRPNCVFTLAEFVQLRSRALYVVLICRPNAFGIPLHEPPPLERITESAGRVG